MKPMKLRGTQIFNFEPKDAFEKKVVSIYLDRDIVDMLNERRLAENYHNPSKRKAMETAIMDLLPRR